jgi:pimeloyl-ACP methyl ester carboxylesterase
VVLLASMLASGKADASYQWWWSRTDHFLTASDVPTARSKWVTIQTSDVTTTYESTYQDAPNYAYRPDANPKNTLVLYLPGTGETTDTATEFMQEAVRQGYHVVGLDYIDGHLISDLCTCNASCFGDAYSQLVTGSEHNFYGLYFGANGTNPGSTFVNGVEFRLHAFLSHMDSVDPSGGWSQYLDSTGDPIWSKIIVSGHSQGGHLAAWIVKNLGAKKGLAFSSPSYTLNRDSSTEASTDYTFAKRTCSASETLPDALVGTPESKMRIFLNEQDERWDYSPNDPDAASSEALNANYFLTQGAGLYLVSNQTSISGNSGGMIYVVDAVQANGSVSAHGSTVINDPNDAPGSAYGPTIALATRIAVWDAMLEQ